MSDEKHNIDWLGFGVHFFFGALLGCVIGFRCWVKSDWALSPSATPGALIVGGCTLLGGLVAGFCKDVFWTGISEVYDDYPSIVLKAVGIVAALAGLIWLTVTLVGRGS